MLSTRNWPAGPQEVSDQELPGSQPPTAWLSVCHDISMQMLQNSLLAHVATCLGKYFHLVWTIYRKYDLRILVKIFNRLTYLSAKNQKSKKYTTFVPIFNLNLLKNDRSKCGRVPSLVLKTTHAVCLKEIISLVSSNSMTKVGHSSGTISWRLMLYFGIVLNTFHSKLLITYIVCVC